MPILTPNTQHLLENATIPKVTRKLAQRKGDRPEKPHPDFPLFTHATGRWAKKVRGKSAYFGNIADDPKGAKALEPWNAQKEYLLAALTPARHPDGTTIVALANAFLKHEESLFQAGEITAWTHREYQATCQRIIKVFGASTPIDALGADDFQRLRNSIAKTWGTVRLGNEIQRVRGVSRFGYEAGLTDRPTRLGPEFKKPSAEVLRQNRAKRGLRMFEREELSALRPVGSSTEDLAQYSAPSGLYPASLTNKRNWPRVTWYVPR